MIDEDAIIARRWPHPLELRPIPHREGEWRDTEATRWRVTKPRLTTCPRCGVFSRLAYFAEDGREWCPAHFVVIPDSAPEPSALTAQERERATTWKWAYQARADYGFDSAIAKRLAFQRWLYQLGRLVG